MKFNHFPPSSRIWTYKSDRLLTISDKKVISDVLNEFIPKWASHGNQLFGGWEIRHDWFVILAVNEDESMASGCSIDSSVQIMKTIGKQIGVDFFNRMNVLIQNEEQMKEVHFSELSEFTTWKVFNPMITSLEELQNSWPQLISESPFA
ncbi:MAG: hypothetical protein MK066_12470 [Crocinitomicaceae bacterium]|nr:hypothetical protein [Crocinitomicaceae bacterium]